MVKNLKVNATYKIVRSIYNYVKIKKDNPKGVGNTLDLVVLGSYLAQGKRDCKDPSFLIAC